ncbi:hypothetical protein EROM_071250 [Encephalitozoon romaleae SJ-2008]|uniref:Protein FAM72 n=1 Tax=Encephalitozoon romaleae (strain SJ-2008) TaxID=1178016 RepID=I6ZUK2_ENCRO|nr:hypothetical protein EROM_071250 [Encephalitozoon romaleae SJ-2008]AFN83376.1 hypothetical protein EROM_071250 [Encephalitozoon romaleae SJ-2008]
MTPYKDRKERYVIRCFGCGNVICRRAARSLLLSSLRIKVYSTNVPTENVKCIGNSYMAYSCKCIVADIECRLCRLILGYHVLQLCELCAGEGKNGRTWIFDASSVISTIIKRCSKACLNMFSSYHEEGDSEVKIR